MTNPFRAAIPVQVALTCACVTAGALIGYDIVAQEQTVYVANEGGRSAATTITATGTGTAPDTPTTDTSGTPKPSFSDAKPGTCLTWDEKSDGTIENFHSVDCAKQHRFEVSSREDLSLYPASEFGPDAPAPNLTRQAQLREELCKAPTIAYLGGHFDPAGRYSIAPILPRPESWHTGDRTMLCGLQTVDDEGVPQLTKGRAAEQDQSRINQAGQCLKIEPGAVVTTVDCDEDHSLEITKVVDLKQKFPDIIPTVTDQDSYLKEVCTKASLDYLGGDDALYNSTLETFWTVIQPDSWQGGSHTANCALIKAGDNGFAILKGPAQGTFTINGEPPPPQPTRRPLRNPPKQDDDKPQP